MDFIVSKVLMSVTALLVVSILAGLLSPDKFVDPDSDLARVLYDLSSTVDRIAMSASEVTITWTVPFLSSGDEVLVTVHHSILSGSSNERTVQLQPVFELHTWSHDGSVLNSSAIDALDLYSDGIGCRSGQKLTISTVPVLLENESRLLVFLTRAP
jgi:hypothetical protein